MPRGYLGVGLQELTPEIARQLKLARAEGVLITGVQPGSPAEKAGLEPGDVVIEFNGEKVHEPTELRLLVAAAKIGSTGQAEDHSRRQRAHGYGGDRRAQGPAGENE